MKLHGLAPVVSLISSAESAEALTLLRSSSYGGSVRRIHPRAHTRGLLRRRISLTGLLNPRLTTSGSKVSSIRCTARPMRRSRRCTVYSSSLARFRHCLFVYRKWSRFVGGGNNIKETKPDVGPRRGRSVAFV